MTSKEALAWAHQLRENLVTLEGRITEQMQALEELLNDVAVAKRSAERIITSLGESNKENREFLDDD
jgi:uncharacterized coiled-coil protein SlyX